MNRRKLKCGGRKKAPFGTQEAAILGAAAINAATQMAAAGINSSATRDAAQRQAAAMNDASIKQAEAIRQQSERSKEFQLESQEFIREQNAENRELQKDIQMQLQMLTGQQNANDRLEASKLKVKNGGSMKRKLRNAGYATFPLQGGDNIPFVVTDGGGVIPIETTPEGYDLYEIVGNDHNHYHKTRGGKNKSGVGIKFAGGGIVEGEGNQHTNQGEYLLNTPTDAYFISKHSIAGVNPANLVNKGMHPLQAYAIQERLKAAKGIKDNGKRISSPVEKAYLGTDVPLTYNLYNENYPQIGIDTIGDTSVGVAVANRKRALRLGGRVKAASGYKWSWESGDWVPANAGDSGIIISEYPAKVSVGTPSGSVQSVTPASTNTTQPKQSFMSRAGDFVSRNADLFGAGIVGLGNLGGAWITSRTNNRAAEVLADAYRNSSSVLADAYRNLSTIDMNSINRENYAAAHALPVLQAPISFANNKIAEVNRQLHRRLVNAGKYSASSAAALKRMSDAETIAQDMRNQVYSEDQQQRQNIIQNNVRNINEAAIENARLDTMAQKDYTNAYLGLLQYNNDIENQRILGPAEALAEGNINAAGAIANARTANGSAWSQALVNSSQGFANSLSNAATRRADLEKIKLGATSDTLAYYYGNSDLASRREAENYYNAIVRQYNSTKNSDTKNILRRRANAIASARGFKLIS